MTNITTSRSHQQRVQQALSLLRAAAHKSHGAPAACAPAPPAPSPTECSCIALACTLHALSELYFAQALPVMVGMLLGRGNILGRPRTSQLITALLLRCRSSSSLILVLLPSSTTWCNTEHHCGLPCQTAGQPCMHA